jgi:hypothetical protein
MSRAGKERVQGVLGEPGDGQAECIGEDQSGKPNE